MLPGARIACLSMRTAGTGWPICVALRIVALLKAPYVAYVQQPEALPGAHLHGTASKNRRKLVRSAPRQRAGRPLRRRVGLMGGSNNQTWWQTGAS